MQSAQVPDTIFRFGLFEADLAENTLTRNGVHVKIQEQPFRVLILLLERTGKIVTREELRQRLWPDGTYVDFDGSLNVILKKLRATLGDDPNNPRFIETVPRHGYRFIAPVSVEHRNSAPADAPASLRPAGADGFVNQGRQWSRRNRLLLYTVSALVLLLIVASTWFVWHASRVSSLRTSASSQPGAPVRLRTSLAVLGFHSTSGRADDSWLATAFAEMLSTELASGEKLRLVSGEGVANLRFTSPWPETGTLDQQTTSRLGTALNSDLLVLGSYTTIGKAEHGQVRLDVRLQDAKTGEILAEVAEVGSTDDLFQIVSRAGDKLRGRLGVPRLEAPDQVSVMASLPANAEAARFYSLGLQKLREYDPMAARGLFEQATKADPKFPLAYSMLSRADIWLGHDSLAKSEARRGFDLSGNLSRVQKMEIEASYYQANADRAKAAEIYRTLFDLFPDSIDYGVQLAKLQLESFHPDESLATIRQLRELPAPAHDDPGLDMREAYILVRKDADAADGLFHLAASKAQAQGKKLAYATAERSICSLNRRHLASPPECTEAYEAFLAAGNRDQAASCLQMMAEAQRLTGHQQEAIPFYHQALAMFKDVGDRENVGVTLNNLSLILEAQGQWDQAENNYREAKKNFELVNDLANTSAAESNIADILVLRGRLREAADLYRLGWETADASKRARHEYAHFQYGAMLLLQGEPKKARAEVEPQVASLREYNGNPWELATALIVLGDIQKAEGSLIDARKSYEEAATILGKANASGAGAEVALASLSVDEGHPETAEPLLRQAIAEYEKDSSAGDEINANTVLARALLAAGKPVETRNGAEHAFKLADLRHLPVLRLPLEVLRARANMAATTQSGGGKDLHASEQQLRSAVSESQQLGLYSINSEARLALAELERRTHPASARAHLSAFAADARGHGFNLIAEQAEKVLSGTPKVLAETKPDH